MTRCVVVLVTVSSTREAAKLSTALVKERLAACVNAGPGLRSRYWWKGKVETALERLLIIKTTRSRFAALARRVKELHSYRVPEILALPVLSGNPSYLRWIDDSLRARKR